MVQKRLFIALSYNDNLVLKKMQQIVMTQLQSFAEKNNCVVRPQEYIHSTLFFLGNRLENNISTIKNECALVIEKHIQKYGTDSLKNYSSRLHFQILGHDALVTALEPNDRLLNLYTLFYQSFNKDQGHEKRPFLPHVTLARIKKLNESKRDKVIKEVAVLLKEINKGFLGSFPLGVDSLILFSSDQGNYTEISQFVL